MTGKKRETGLAARTEGTAAVEGMIILSFLIFFVVFLMSFGFLLYQQWHLVTVANDTATRIAQSYAYGRTDPVTGYISRGMRVSLSPYRYMEDRLVEENRKRGEAYAAWGEDSLGFAYRQGDPDIRISTVYDGLARRHVLVELEATYEIPFGGALAFFGMEKTVTYHASGRAVCIDISNYIYTVTTVKTLSSAGVMGEIAGAVDKVLGFINHIISAIQSW